MILSLLVRQSEGLSGQAHRMAWSQRRMENLAKCGQKQERYLVHLFRIMYLSKFWIQWNHTIADKSLQAKLIAFRSPPLSTVHKVPVADLHFRTDRH